MKKCRTAFVGLVMLLSTACGGIDTPEPILPTATPPTIIADTKLPSATAIPFPVLALTAPVKPSPTVLATSTAEAVATISPTFSQTPSPTFDVASAVTRTAAPSETCVAPKPQMALQLTIDPTTGLVNVERPVLDFLNAGGTRLAVIEAVGRANSSFKSSNYLVEADLTGDGVPELVVSEANLYIFGCSEGRYQTLYEGQSSLYGFASTRPADIVTIADMNLDGIPEVVTHREDAVNYIVDEIFRVIEWNGQGFTNLVTPLNGYSRHLGGMTLDGEIYAETGGDACFTGCVHDVDGNGTLELVVSGGLNGGIRPDAQSGPWRAEIMTYMWNGRYFGMLATEMTPPEFRFQAVNDADEATLDGKYARALGLYQQAIFDEKLDWYSEERWYWQSQLDIFATPTPPMPSPDPKEYPNLAAYARYRIVLLHLLQGDAADAKTVYDTLEQKFPNGQQGHAFAEMATLLWNGYIDSKNLSGACELVVEYATQNSETVLKYLDAPHGFQGRHYEPEDLCPVK